jgi:hypothetical protein
MKVASGVGGAKRRASRRPTAWSEQERVEKECLRRSAHESAGRSRMPWEEPLEAGRAGRALHYHPPQLLCGRRRAVESAAASPPPPPYVSRDLPARAPVCSFKLNGGSLTSKRLRTARLGATERLVWVIFRGFSSFFFMSFPCARRVAEAGPPRRRAIPPSKTSAPLAALSLHSNTTSRQKQRHRLTDQRRTPISPLSGRSGALTARNLPRAEERMLLWGLSPTARASPEMLPKRR